MDAPAISNLPERGVVKWFDPRRGFGFIVDAQGRDVFVHFKVIDGEGFRQLRDGEKVAYSFTTGPRGLHALRVRSLRVLRDTGPIEVRAPQRR